MKVRKQNLKRISQGDIYKNVEYVEYIAEQTGKLKISKILFPYIIVLTQDCDLEQDFKFRYGRPRPKTQDKYLLSVLAAPLYNAEHVFLGEHLDELGIKMRKINKRKTEGKKVMQNQDPRYHYIEFPEDIPIVASVIDFKHYFAVNIEYLKKEKKSDFVCRIPQLYREDLSIRYANFLARIGLPSS